MSEQPVVSTKQGQLRGRADFDHDGSRYYSFFGIPYAKPPLGDLRFKAPQPPEPWEGIRDATQEGDECYSYHIVFNTPVGSENCLILNVFTPELPQSERNPTLKPVMFWIHGGGFTQGSSKTEAYSPDFLICEDVVIVTINYRLGALGFLSFEDPALGVPGNAGLKDMAMALKWVQANIAAFNGDPNNVTIFGESAGGASVHLLMLSPMAKNLFHKAIAQSGSALNIWVQGQKGGRELAKHLGYTGNDEAEILKVLTEASMEDLLKAQVNSKDPVHASDRRPLGPVVEKYNTYEESFLPDEPLNTILSGNYSKVPLMMGYNNREGFLFEVTETDKFSQKIINFEKSVPYTMKLPQGSPASKDIARRIKEFYFGKQEQDLKDNLESFYKLQSDNFFYRGIYSAIKNHLETATTPIYFYRFSFEGKLNIYKNFTHITQKGVSHADELGYLFKMAIIPEIRQGSPEDLTIRRMAKLWTNFAKRGDPNPIRRESLIQVTWPPCERDNLKYLEIEENLSVGNNPDLERMKFWDYILSVNPATSKL